MADRYPLIVDSSTSTVKELPSGDNLDLANSGLTNVVSIAVTNINISGVATFQNNYPATSAHFAGTSHAVAIGTASISSFPSDQETVLDVFGNVFIDGSIGIGTTNRFIGIGTTTGVGVGTVRLDVGGDVRFNPPGIKTDVAYYAANAQGYPGINTSFGQWPGQSGSGHQPETRIVTRDTQTNVTPGGLNINNWNRQQYFATSQFRIHDSMRAFTLANNPSPRIFGQGHAPNSFYNAVGMGFHIVPNNGSDVWGYFGYTVEAGFKDRFVWGSNFSPTISGLPAGLSRETMTLVNSQRRLGIGTTAPTQTLHVVGSVQIDNACTIDGALSKGSGSFNIPHPVLADKRLVHSFIEGPKCDLIYRGKVTLTGGSASVNMDTEVGLSAGTWDALTRDPQVFVQNNAGWTAVKGAVSGSTLTITAQDASCTDEIDWMVVAERQDDNIKGADWTDSEGRPILEPDPISENRDSVEGINEYGE